MPPRQVARIISCTISPQLLALPTPTRRVADRGSGPTVSVNGLGPTGARSPFPSRADTGHPNSHCAPSIIMVGLSVFFVDFRAASRVGMMSRDSFCGATSLPGSARAINSVRHFTA